ncbi:MAG: hypothetical protein Q4C98_06230 [Capnocytophaga sp.]|nr:hypothetical protein [Capnocytophaga sp.]
MKKLLRLLSILGIFCFFVSCSKSSNETEYFIRYKINGEQKYFSNGSEGTNYKYKKGTQQYFLLYVSGNSVKSIDAPESISIDMYVPETSNASLVAGTYTTGNTSGSNAYYLDVKYFKNNAYYYDDDFVVTFTQLDKQTARGTFSGTLASGDVITEGEFFTEVYYVEVD